MPEKRDSQPWSLRRQRGSRNLFVRFSHDGFRFEESTGTHHPKEAARRAAVIYAEVVSGKRKPPARLMVDKSTPIDELASLWLADISCDEGPYLIYARHWQRYFGKVGNLTRGKIAEYWRHRLGVVLRRTAVKERGPLEDFLDWCTAHKVLSAKLEVPPLPDGRKRQNQGTPFEKRRRVAATELSSKEARQIVLRLPEWSKSKREKRFPVRARFIVALETGLRPKTLDQLRVPENYEPGASVLTITDSIDKNNFGRQLPLTKEAREALDSVCPAEGVIFGKHDYRYQLQKAAKGVLPEHRSKTFTAYDLRHRRLTELATTGNLPGAAYLAGHLQVTTLNRYAKPERQAADDVLAQLAQTGVVAWGSASLSLGSTPTPDVDPALLLQCEGEDSNLPSMQPHAAR